MGVLRLHTTTPGGWSSCVQSLLLPRKTQRRTLRSDFCVARPIGQQRGDEFTCLSNVSVLLQHLQVGFREAVADPAQLLGPWHGDFDSAPVGAYFARAKGQTLGYRHSPRMVRPHALSLPSRCVTLASVPGFLVRPYMCILSRCLEVLLRQRVAIIEGEGGSGQELASMSHANVCHFAPAQN